MAHKMAAAEAPPPKPEGVRKELAANQDGVRKSEAAATTEEYGYIVTKQRCSQSDESMCQSVSE